ncbi:MAG: HAMP domain-containing histidine kinase [Alphaproteobacteria bacterium]|nr:HAMP domain-containing histidine kinase [Alphaproteobacteria bacterium]MBT4016537.1 HAMP domain-containing histidine kinase [Alphaproteobacteria bacterium]MBT4967178.1 HAMP domain-containing histidine kinase [Alphaproteobacteria bacterium]MBT5158545.1 HAMP domain-containing histidine kinase [Alphaproteobacteria bacterium]MBT6385747.1 HAMP domain-containing histidine kinase [Alphaproteobacteria bacterium]
MKTADQNEADVQADDVEALVRMECVRLSYQHGLGNRFRILFAYFWIGAALWYAGLETNILVVWACAAFATNIATGILEMRYHSADVGPTNAGQWGWYRVILSFFGALPLGLAAFILPATQNLVPELILFIVLATTGSIACAGFSTLPAVYLAVSAGSVGLASIAFLIRQEEGYLILAAIGASWLIVTLRSAMGVSHSTIGAIRSNERLRLEIEQHEITRSKLTDLNNQKDQFFSIIAHDLLSPFTILLNYSQMLKTSARSISREKVAELSGALNEATEGALLLVQDLLGWSQIRMHQRAAELEPCPLRELIAETLREIEFVAHEKNIQLIDESTAMTAMADRQMCRTVLRNLISNAIKFTPEEGQIKVTAASDGKVARINICDSGIGVEAARLETLFDIDPEKSTDGTSGESGTGLGLVLCKEFVENQGGKIQAQSTPGEGSTFSFTLPLAS